MRFLALSAAVLLGLSPLAGAATSPAFGAAGTPHFDVYAAPSSLRNADNAGEPSIGIPWNTNHAFYQADASTYKVEFNDAQAHDGAPAATWTDASPAFTKVNVDPML